MPLNHTEKTLRRLQGYKDVEDDSLHTSIHEELDPILGINRELKSGGQGSQAGPTKQLVGLTAAEARSALPVYHAATRRHTTGLEG